MTWMKMSMLLLGGEELSEEFKEKAKTIFEAAQFKGC